MVIIKFYENDKKVKKFINKLSKIIENMKNLIKTISWINRLLMFPFVLTLLMSILNNESFVYSLYIAFILGLFQLSSFLLTLFCWNKLKDKNKKYLIIYILLVFTYFFLGFLQAQLNNNLNQNIFLTIVFVSVPIILSIYWTYVIEIIKKEL